MTFLSHPTLRCPLDQLPLRHQQHSLVCERGHSYDIARQGYVNLLTAQDKRSKDPGDSKAMVSARRAFLEAGYYQPLADGFAQHVLPHLAEDSLLVDAGCGEGYYLQHLSNYLDQGQHPAPWIIGFDISKWAVQAAARTRDATWLVASNRQIPLADATADIVTSLFGFPHYREFMRILKPAGLLLLVEAGSQHLMELREVIYDQVKEPVEKPAHAIQQAGFIGVAKDRVRFTSAELPAPAITQLLQMTPHLFRASTAGKQRAADLQAITLTVDVVFSLYRRA
jgi:23S rRNA (guanine745-N1)-methyltransferase